MINKIIKNKDKLLEISRKKTELLQSIIEYYDHIADNSIFIEEIQDSYQGLIDEEAELVLEKEKMIECPGCGFDCAQIHTYCMACGIRLPDLYSKGFA
ncbi:hypothetical protein KKA14_06155 [bacterium]|nr:hypothetical protein [bacterium]